MDNKWFWPLMAGRTSGGHIRRPSSGPPPQQQDDASVYHVLVLWFQQDPVMRVWQARGCFPLWARAFLESWHARTWAWRTQRKAETDRQRERGGERERGREGGCIMKPTASHHRRHRQYQQHQQHQKRRIRAVGTLAGRAPLAPFLPHGIGRCGCITRDNMTTVAGHASPKP